MLETSLLLIRIEVLIFYVIYRLTVPMKIDVAPGRGGGGVLDLNLYGDVPTTKNFFTLLQNFSLQLITPF